MAENVIEITSKEEWFEFIKGSSTVTDFARRNGCVPCKRLEPHYEKAAENLSDIKFAKVLMDEVEPDFLDYIMDDLKIMGTPTVLHYTNGALNRGISGRTAPVIIKELSE